jgi:transcriptional activator SPT8
MQMVSPCNATGFKTRLDRCGCTGRSSDSSRSSPFPSQPKQYDPKPPSSADKDASLLLSEYTRKIQNRLANFLSTYHTLPSLPGAPQHPLSAYQHATSYGTDPLAACPMLGTHVHCMALNADGSVLLSGGSDGYVRRYDVYGTVNGKNMLTASVRHQFPEGFTRGGAISAYYPNEEDEEEDLEAKQRAREAAAAANAEKQTKGGKKGKGKKRQKGGAGAEDGDDMDDNDDDESGRSALPISPVHSLACHSQALWAASGTQSGAINLFTLRHVRQGSSGSADQNGYADAPSSMARRRGPHLQHVLKRHKGPVSSLLVTPDEQGLISGGWDRNVLQWDLNSGSVVREYPSHVGQISSLSFRPIRTGNAAAARARNSPGRERGGSVISINGSAMMNQGGTSQGQELERSPSKAGHTPSTPLDTTIPIMSTQDEGVEKTSPEKNDAAEERSSSRSPSAAVTAAESLPAPDEEVRADEEEEKKGRAINETATAAAAAVDAEGDVNMAGQSKANDTEAPTAPITASADGTAESPSSPEKPSGGGPGTGNGPTEEDLALEAELNESLGLGLSNKDGGLGGGQDDDEDEMALIGIAANKTAGDSAQQEQRKASLSGASLKKRKSTKDDADDDSDGGSLFGDGSDAEADADGEADISMMDVTAVPGKANMPGEADAEGEDEDADGEDEQPLFMTMDKSQAMAGGTATLPGGPTSTNGKVNGSAVTPATNGKMSSMFSKPALQKSALGSLTGSSGFDADVSQFSQDVLLTSTLGGQVMLWDRRIKPDGKGGVHALPLPDKTPPWCASATWSTYGDRIYVGRRNETIEEWDLRALGTGSSSNHSKPKVLNTLKFPVGCGPITSIISMPNDRHLICGSQDNVRLWDTSITQEAGKVPFKIVAGHNGAWVSSLRECYRPESGRSEADFL